MQHMRQLVGRSEVEDLGMIRDGYVIRKSESGDYYILPEEYADSFWEDELNDEASYATYINLEDLVIYDCEY